MANCSALLGIDQLQCCWSSAGRDDSGKYIIAEGKADKGDDLVIVKRIDDTPIFVNAESAVSDIDSWKETGVQPVQETSSTHGRSDDGKEVTEPQPECPDKFGLIDSSPAIAGDMLKIEVDNSMSLGSGSASFGSGRPVKEKSTMTTDSEARIRDGGLGLRLSGILDRNPQLLAASVESHHADMADLVLHLVDKLIISGLTETHMDEVWPEKMAALRRVCRVDNCRKVFLNGSRLLLGALALLLAHRVFINLSRRSECDFLSSNTGLRVLCIALEAALCVSVAVVVFRCRSHTFAEKECWRKYYGCVTVTALYTLLMFVPPLALPCDDIIKVAQCRKTRFHFGLVAEADCAMQGTTAMIICICFAALAPHLLPEVRDVFQWANMYLLSWCVCSAITAIFFGQLHSVFDVACAFGFMLLICLVSVGAKKHLVQRHTSAFKLKHFCQEDAKNMFKIFECMVPLHVVVPMLRSRGEVIAQQIDKASVLFVVIEGFEQWGRHKEPREVLEFLNSIFSKMDSVCELNDVMKIETVSEEYVAAVGVAPLEHARSNDDHSLLLGGLVNAVVDLFAFRPHEHLGFKMGLHTGSLVAGVIGEKLPRFRLFGDTMNTAARMMQKGSAGKAQFSEETKNHLPGWAHYKHRGPIEMKGKGLVETYKLDWKTIYRERGQRSTPRTTIKTEVSDDSNKSTFSTWAVDDQPVLDKHMSENVKFATVVKALDHDLQMQKSKTVGSDLQKTKSFSTVLGSKSIRSTKSGMIGRVSHTISTPTQSIKDAKSFFGFGSSGLSDYDLSEVYETFCRERLMNSRGDLETCGLLVLTVLEFLAAVAFGTWDDEHQLVGIPRYLSFLICRLLAAATLMLWWVVACYALKTMSLGPALVTRTLLACVVIALIFFSYEALTPKLHEFTEDHGEHHIKATLSDEFNLIRIWPLLFLFVFFTMMVNLRLPPLNMLIFLCWALLLVGVGSRSTVVEADFHMEFGIDQLCGFAIIGLLSIEKTRSELQQDKGNCKLERAMSLTRDRVGEILESLLPPLVVEELRESGGLPCHRYQNATIAQSDLVGFTALASTRQPQEVVEFIRDLFGIFDDIADKYGIYKIETVGDAYIAGQAERPLTQENKPLEVVRFALEITQATQAWSSRKGQSVNCRVGIHTGPCIGGIVGISMQRYHLFGSLLSCLEGLESTSEAGKVQISKACHELAKKELLLHASEYMSEEDRSLFEFEMRTTNELKTSKGDVVDFEAVGGYPTYFAHYSGNHVNLRTPVHAKMLPLK